MGSGGAKHRGKRPLQGKKATGKFSGYGSQGNAFSSLSGLFFFGLAQDTIHLANMSTAVPDLDPAMSSRALLGWQSLPDRTNPSSLIQEARNTERHGFGRGSSARLRDSKIQFVRAGNLGMNESESEADHMNRDHLTGKMLPTEANTTSQADAVARPPEGQPLSEEVSNREFEHNHASITEQVGRMEIVAEPGKSAPVEAGGEAAPRGGRPRSPSESSVASEEEVIIFGGRRGDSNKPAGRRENSLPNITIGVLDKEGTAITENKRNLSLDNRRATSTTHPSFAQSPAGSGSSEELCLHKKKFLEPEPNFGRRRGRAARAQRTSQSQDDEDGQLTSAASGPQKRPSTRDAPPEPTVTAGRRGQGRRTGLSQLEIEEEALIQDYIENMRMDDTDDEEEDVPVRNEHFRLFDGTGEAEVKVQTWSRNKEKLPDLLDEDLEWSSGDLEDFDDISTTTDEITEVGRVYAERIRPSGSQYLVTAVGKGPDDACWTLREKLSSATAVTQIQVFEKRREAKRDLGDQASDSTTDSDENELLNDVIDTITSKDDENERLFERTTRMTDEQIAQALSMQEELGMPTNEVLLFNGQEDDEFPNGDHFIPFSSKQHQSTRRRSTRNTKKDNFPSAEAFADALDQDPYKGFDVMDYDRPSLKPKRKGRKTAGLPFEFEDEELAFQLQQSWENDRSKKAARKREREEMRQVGLLGSKASNGRVDLHSKYEESGMDAEQIRAEIRSFLVQEVEAVALAPMAADMRASVHRLARALNLKSHSQGKADGRFPILTKTAHTQSYTINNVWEVDALLSQRKFFPKNKSSFKTAKQPRGGPKVRRSGGGGVAAAASYMDGDVVGASAPEIGADNRGRAMLEKMGWSSGMGIGKVGNQGSTEVIKHVVKNTKAGLG